MFRTYEQLSQDAGEASFSFVYFLNNLSYMQSLGLVMLMQTKVNRAYTSKVSLLFSERVLDSICGIRIRVGVGTVGVEKRVICFYCKVFSNKY